MPEDAWMDPVRQVQKMHKIESSTRWLYASYWIEGFVVETQ